ncbi:hypothetical protein FHL15_003187 [Xylaria flabelliformis]|uniref:Coenzyme Q-binding protein COQ10 START domain-containing protein n=1 Tax=Xylaria flabelliformis TaxID=2512241 RepID=A0A553I765_9PEZI|nr:hypothetical protein FHL15_003187 [Xylaria flabelliformis]
MISVQISLLIDAPPHKVWTTLADLEHWPDWNSFFTRMQIQNQDKDMGIVVGTKMQFTNRISPGKSGNYEARITQWVPGKTFTWVSGPSPWLEWLVYGEHWFQVQEEKSADGTSRTRLLQGENIGGCVSLLLPASMAEDLATKFRKFNEELRCEVDRR